MAGAEPIQTNYFAFHRLPASAASSRRLYMRDGQGNFSTANANSPPLAPLPARSGLNERPDLQRHQGSTHQSTPLILCRGPGKIQPPLDGTGRRPPPRSIRSAVPARKL